MPAPKISGSQNSKITIGISTIIFLSYFAVGLYHLYRNHPFEDAYIIFKYAENLAGGHGLVYYQGGPRAEGYVDFLWIIFLGFLIKIGFDVAVAALTLNSIGAALSSYIFAKEIDRSALKPPFKTLFFLFCFIPVIFSGALAGYLGFSTMLYSGLILLLYRISLEETPDSLHLVFLLSLIIGLFRIEGFIIGTGYSALSLYIFWRKKILSRKHIYVLLLCFALAAAYQYFRYRYFGLLLPLPLYVKSTGRLIEGFYSNFGWLIGYGNNVEGFGSRGSGPIPGLLIFFIAVICLGLKNEAKKIKNLFVSALPIGVYLFILCFFTQSQNLFYRYQAPVLLVLFFILLRCIITTFEQPAPPFKRLTAVLCLIYITSHSAWSILEMKLFYSKNHQNPHYFYNFAYRLHQRLDRSSVMVITEAGALAYWNNCRIEDAVGLNTPHTALNPLSVEYLESLSPDLIMFHTRDILTVKSPLAFQIIPGGELENYIQNTVYKTIFNEGLKNYKDRAIYSADLAPLIMAAYLKNRYADYDVAVVMNKHVYGIKKSFKNAGAILEDLKNSISNPSISYARLKHFRLS